MKKDSKAVLLDVNVLVALGWTTHPFHALVTERMERQSGPWFTCALTQLGFIRLSANPAVTQVVVTAGEAARLMARITSDAGHRFLQDIVPPEDTASIAVFDRVLGPQQVTDAYLLSLAVRNGATLLTLDGRMTALAEDIADLEVVTPR